MTRLIAILLGLFVHIFAFSQVLMLDTNAHIGFYQEFDNVEGFEHNYGVESYSNNRNEIYSISIYDSDTSLYKMSVVKNDNNTFSIDFMLFAQSKNGFSVLFSEKKVYSVKDFEFYNVNINGTDTHYSVLKLRVDFTSIKANIRKNDNAFDYSDFYVIR